MFGRLVRKELLHHLLDLRFLVVFALCALLSVLSVHVGGRNYSRRLQEYSEVSESTRQAFQKGSLSKGRLWDMTWVGIRWHRRPEVLSPVVYGLSGALGQEVNIKYQQPSEFEASPFETDPTYALFEVLDMAYVVKVCMSLAVLLFTFDAVCGEKEGGTLRLYASFAVPRSRLALAKLAGATVAIWTPFVFAFLLVSLTLALSPGVGLQTADWGRMAALTGVFGLYLTVFAAFGLWVSALTHRRMTAFLALLSLWAVWVFVVPSLAVDAARRLAPARSSFDLQKQAGTMHWETRMNQASEKRAYHQRNPVKDWSALSTPDRQTIQDALNKIEGRWDAEYHARLGDLQKERRHQLRRQQRLALFLMALSPLGAVTYASTDLARTGFIQQERIEDAVNAYRISLSQYVLEKTRKALGRTFEGVNLTDFVWFTYQDRDSLGECLSRNAFHILNLALLAIVGFAGAYVAILRYDVR